MAASTIVLLLRDDERDGITRWLIAAVVVLALHVGLAALHLLLKSEEPEGAPEVPAIVIDLAPMPVAPASQMDIAPGPESFESQPPPKPKAEEQPPPEPVVEMPPAEKPDVALAPQPPKPEVKPLEKQPVRPVELKPEPVPEQTERSNVQTAPPKAERVARTPATPRMGARAVNTVSPSWVSMLMAHLNRHKQYPASARANNQQGTVTVSFVMNRDGHVLSSRIARSSGSAALDAEALAMLQRSQPLPHFAPEMAGSTRSFNAPIRFSLK